VPNGTFVTKKRNQGEILMSRERYLLPEEMAQKTQRRKRIAFISFVLAIMLLSALITILAN
jgi:hypothetical protein